MATAAIEPVLKGTTSSNTRGLLRVIILVLIAAAAVASRLFSVISKKTICSCCFFVIYGMKIEYIDANECSNIGFESIIHECMFATGLNA